MVESLETADYVSIAVYFVLVLAVGIWSTCRPNRDSAAGYFLAGKSMHWFPVGASMYASNVGAPMFVGLAGTAAASGFAVAIYEWHAIYLLVALGWVFLPVYVASGSFTSPEYLKKRFGGIRLSVALSVLSLFLYILTRISSEIYSGALFISLLLGLNLYVCVLAILAVTAVYTVMGGLAAVIYTDTLQVIILIIGSSILTVLSFQEVGGWDAMMTKYSTAATNYTLADPTNYSCGLPRDDFNHIWRDPVTGDIPWTGAVFGLTTMGIVVWCTEQIMVQRCLAAKNISHAKGGTVVAAFLKIFNFFLWIVPGMIARILFPDEIACADPNHCERVCQNRAGCTNIAYPLLVLRRMPTGLKGVMLAALLAALMSSLTSVFNSASSVFTMDVWRRFRRKASEHELMIVGRAAVLVLVGISILWLPVLQVSQSGQLWNYIAAVGSFTSPTWCCVYLLAMFWKRTTEQGAFWGLIIGIAVGAVRLIMEFSYQGSPCGSFEPDTRPEVLAKVNFLHFGFLLFGICVISTVVISLCTTPRPPEKLRRVTFWTLHSAEDREPSDAEDDTDDGDDDDDFGTKGMKKVTKWRRIYNWMCGLDNRPKPKLTPEQREIIREKMTSISESPSAKRLTNIAAITSCLVVTYLLGYFG